MIETGMVVRSIAGHDKDHFYVVVGIEEKFALIADGKVRKLEKPKRKNLIHLRKTNTKLDLEQVTGNKMLHDQLKSLNFT